MPKSGEFKCPDLVQPIGATKYVKGPRGEMLGPGYMEYEPLVGEDEKGVTTAVLVGWIGAMTYVLHGRSLLPLQFGRSGRKGSKFFGYIVEGGRLYGLGAGPNEKTDLCVWPPRSAYVCEREPSVDDEDDV